MVGKRYCRTVWQKMRGGNIIGKNERLADDQQCEMSVDGAQELVGRDMIIKAEVVKKAAPELPDISS